MNQFYKGIFWFDPRARKLMVRKTACDKEGKAFEAADYTSKSGDNFNHKIEWSRFSNKLTGRKPYNYYPRGRVEIKKGKAAIYMNPVLMSLQIKEMVKDEFSLSNETIEIRFIADGSSHYEYLTEF